MLQELDFVQLPNHLFEFGSMHKHDRYPLQDELNFYVFSRAFSSHAKCSTEVDFLTMSQRLAIFHEYLYLENN